MDKKGNQKQAGTRKWKETGAETEMKETQGGMRKSRFGHVTVMFALCVGERVL